MRNTTILTVLTALVVMMAAVSAVSAATLDQWASSPITVGDKLFTLVSTTWAGGDNFNVSDLGGNFYAFTFTPVSDNVVTSTSKSLIFKVTIVDNPGTPMDESLLMHFSQVSGDGNRYIASGSFTVAGLFDDTSDFSSPLVTFSNSGTPWGPSAVAGTVKELFVKLTFTASGGSTILSGYSATFLQAESPVPTEPATWGGIKALYQ